MEQNDDKKQLSELDDGFEKMLRKAVRFKERSELKAYLQALDRQDSAKISGKHPVIRMILPYAAAICLLAVSTLMLFRSDIFDNPSKIAEQYYKPYPNVYKPITRSQLSTSADLEMLALSAYEAGQYDIAEKTFLKIEDLNDYQKLYLALAQWESGKNLEARKLMNELVKASANLKGIANWYAALFALEDKEVEMAKAYLNELIGMPTNQPYQKEARKILDKL